MTLCHVRRRQVLMSPEAFRIEGNEVFARFMTGMAAKCMN